MIDIIGILMSLIVIGVIIFLGGFLIIGIIALIYLVLTGRRWD